MDPQACFERFCAAVRAADWEEVESAVDDYNGWIFDGGLPATDGADDPVARLSTRGRYLAEVDGDARWREVAQ